MIRCGAVDPKPVDLCRTCRKTVPRVSREAISDGRYVVDDTQALWCSQLCYRLDRDAQAALERYELALRARRLEDITEQQLREERYRLRMAYMKVDEVVLHVNAKGKEWHDTQDLLDKLTEDIESGWIIDPAGAQMVAA